MTKEQIAEMLKFQADVVQKGYAGVVKGTGMLVDRRQHPDAIPVQKNTLLGVPEPKEVTNERVGHCEI